MRMLKVTNFLSNPCTVCLKKICVLPIVLKKKQEEKNLGTENFHLEKNNALSLPLKQSVNLSAVEITMNDELPRITMVFLVWTVSG